MFGLYFEMSLELKALGGGGIIWGLEQYCGESQNHAPTQRVEGSGSHA